MTEEEYVEMKKKELRLVHIKVAKKDKDKGFDILINAPFAMLATGEDEYRISELALGLLDKEGIEYEVLK